MNLTKNLSESLSFWNSSPKSPNALKATQTFMWRTVQNTKNNLFGYVIEAVLSPVIMLLIFSYLFGEPLQDQLMITFSFFCREYLF